MVEFRQKQGGTMHTMSKLSTIAASATLLAALSAFGEGSTTVTFGDPVVSSGLTSISVRQPYELTGDGEITGVSLSLGNAEGSLSPSDVTPVFADGVASFELTDLPNYTTYYWQLTFRINDEGGVTEQSDTEIRSASTKRVATFIPGTAAYGAAGSWNISDVPRDAYTDIVIDGDENTPSEATLTIPWDDNTWNAGSALITAGDSFKITNAGKKNTGGTFTANYQSITNWGTVTVSTSANGNGQNISLNCREANSFHNKPNAVIQLFNTSSRNQCKPSVNVYADGGINDGTIYVSQTASDRNRVSFALNGQGVFINNGLIRSEIKDVHTSTESYAAVSVAGGVEISGTGCVFLDEELYTGTANNSRLSIGGTEAFTNGINHTIMGAGNIGNGAICNAGLVLATNSMGYALFVQNTIRDSNGKPIENLSTGRIVAANAGGLYLGANDAKARNSQFINSGLLEARSGSFIAFRTGVTEQGGKNTIATTTPMNQGGRWAGGGEFRIPRPLTLTENSVIAPGDLANTLAEDGETVIYGTGESTCGTLTFTNSLTMNAGTVCEFQFQKKDKFDTLHVGGTLKVDGTLKIVGKPHGGTFRMITSDNPITSDNEKFFAAIDLSVAEGGSKPLLKSGSETKNVTVETGETDPDTGDPITETVEKTIYYIEATFGDGFSIIIR
jgi:hypothetical protein